MFIRSIDDLSMKNEKKDYALRHVRREFDEYESKVKNSLENK